MRTAHPFTLVYRETGYYAHIRELLTAAHPEEMAAWTYDDWLGTGSQDEYEKARELPLCPRCKQARRVHE
jgi:hypothetical protein